MARDMTVTDWIRRHMAGAPVSLETAAQGARDVIYGTSFAHRMESALILGCYRYEVLGRLRQYCRIASAIARLERYGREGNREDLVDAANLIALEWHQPNHPRSHWRGRDREADGVEGVELPDP